MFTSISCPDDVRIKLYLERLDRHSPLFTNVEIMRRALCHLKAVDERKCCIRLFSSFVYYY
jgi:hypothetical protein